MSETATGKTCPYCRTTIEPGVQTVVCPQCGIPHHADCWQENGRCTTFGCQGGGPGLAPLGGNRDMSYGGERPCPHCGFMMRPNETVCPYCRTPIFQARRPAPGMRSGMHPVRPHRGGSVLAYGLLSFIPCCGIFFGIAAWTTANEDLAAIDAGIMEGTGRELTEVGRILGIVSVCLQCALIVISLLGRWSHG